MNHCVVAALLLVSASSVLGQEVGVPDPSSIAVPDLRVEPKDLGDDRKFFFFHKEGVGFEQAYVDLSFCSRYIARGQQRSLPTFVHWQNADPATPIPVATNFGLVGLGIAAIIDGPIERSIRQARMMRCMLPRGYARYRTSEALWKQVNNQDMAASVAIQARIAAGPVPPTPRTLP